jgi:hypothetical protein
VGQLTEGSNPSLSAKFLFIALLGEIAEEPQAELENLAEDRVFLMRAMLHLLKERSHSGLVQRFTKPPSSNVPRVRIPLSPPEKFFCILLKKFSARYWDLYCAAKLTVRQFAKQIWCMIPLSAELSRNSCILSFF